MLYKEIKYLIAKDFALELKQKYALNGILLYVLSTVFVSYLSFERIIDSRTWNALFWIIMLFSAVNAVSKSFVQESQGRQLYYYTLVSPRAVILSKIVYNLLLMAVIALLCFGVFSMFMGSMIDNYPRFLAALLLGGWGFSGILTMVAAIASRSGNNFALMAILSFPIVLPLLLTLIRFSLSALVGGPLLAGPGYILVLLGLNLLVIALATLLFPYLWHD